MVELVLRGKMKNPGEHSYEPGHWMVNNLAVARACKRPPLFNVYRPERVVGTGVCF